MSLPRYPEYRDSGVAWLGEVPTHWDVAPFKWLVEFQNGSDHKAIEVDDGYPVYGSGGVFAYASDYTHDGESVLLGRKGTVDKPLYVTGKFWTVDTMYWTRIAPDACGKFCYYAATSIPFAYYSTNTALPSMTQSALGAHLVAFPHKEEQSAIAAFLDRETAKIDALIAEQEKLLALLAEKRQATISHAVTRGLDLSVPMKDSGIPWLGQVPAHWEVAELRRFVHSFEQGWSPECESRTVDEGEWGVLKAGCVNGGVFAAREHKALPISLEPKPELEVRSGDVLMSRASGSPKLIGSVAFVDNPPPRLMLSDKIFRIRLSSGVDFRFFALLMGSDPLRQQIEQAIGGAEGLANNLPQSSIKEFWVAMPPESEQEAILAEVNKELMSIHQLGLAAEQAVQLLKERRSALVAAAVTGKIDVRGAIAEREAA